MTTIAESIVQALTDHGVTQMWGVVGDALNPITDAIRHEPRATWVGVRHEEAAAFAVGAQAQVTGRLGVCMGTVGPGSIHLLNGLYDAKKSHAPVLAILGQVPSPEIGSEFFQEVDNHRLFADVAVFSRTVTDPAQMPLLLEQAVNAAYDGPGVAVLTVPGDMGSQKLPHGSREPVIAPPATPATAAAASIDAAREVLREAEHVTLLVGIGAQEARGPVLELAERLQAPMVVTLKGKDTFDEANPFEVGQSGLIGNPAAQHAFDKCDVLVLIGTDFPYREWYPEGKTVIQLDRRQAHIGRRTAVQHAMVGDAGATVRALLDGDLPARTDTTHLDRARRRYLTWQSEQERLVDPDHDEDSLLGKVRSVLDNPEELIRPEVVAAALDRHAAADAVFTSDTGMSTVWLSRFVRMTGGRRLLGSFNLGSMANALPQALGVQALDRERQVISCSGDGGLMMLLGDLRTAVTYELPVKVLVFDNGRLGMVKLEQEQGGLPEFGTRLDNPDLARVGEAMGLASRQVSDPDGVDDAVTWLLGQDGPALLDVRTNPEEISLPPKATVGQGWGFAIAKITENLPPR
ncbi:pyruvate oxidase [Brachybacterium avium]|uniref:Pyruvate oxidase n=1 Tax=Brachybacterium avium TaxID=2017485 RepID=A0A220UAK2_9MICO|nr:thiamine pyrophosphate-dependent enzyme [Brachybacterium avium]ASK65137.1 pyruvate oxidase [Brachybacterium avium]